MTNNSPFWKRWYEGKDFSADWTSKHFPIWAEILEPIRNNILNVLEIGSWEGRSAIFFLEFLPNSHVTCIDTFSGNDDKIYDQYRKELSIIESRFEANTQAYANRIRKIRGRSAGSLDTLGASKAHFDLIYIDGSHIRDDVLVDSLLAWPLLKENGILIWDDYKWHSKKRPPSERPQQAIDAFLLLHSGELTMLQRGYQIIAKKGFAAETFRSRLAHQFFRCALIWRIFSP